MYAWYNNSVGIGGRPFLHYATGREMEDYMSQETKYNVQTQQEFAVELYALLQDKLGRGERKVSNSAFNEVLGTYIQNGFNKPNDILNHLATIKPAKSIDALKVHILSNEKMGTRTDRTERDFTGLVF